MSTEPSKSKALFDLSDKELKERIRRQSEHLEPTINGDTQELHRRELRRWSRITVGAGVASVIVAFASFIVAIASVMVAWLK